MIQQEMMARLTLATLHILAAILWTCVIVVIVGVLIAALMESRRP